MQKNSETVISHIKIPVSLAKKIDTWSETHTIKPSRARAILYLIELGLKTAK